MSRRSSRASRSPPPKGMALSPSTPSLSALGTPGSAAGGLPKSYSTRALSPNTAAVPFNRPKLPAVHNALLASFTGKAHTVKMQTLTLQDGGGQVKIARIKCPVPKGTPGHLIKRFDTNAVSASSFFRAAYPTASDEEEASEMLWISKTSRGRYGDTIKAGFEDDEKRRLSGTWIPNEYATRLAEEYKLVKFAADLISFVDPDGKEDVVVIPDSESESPVKTRSPRSKRQRVTSPPASAKKAAAAAATPVPAAITVQQTVETDTMTGIQTEEILVEVAVPEGTTGLIGTDEQAAAAAKEAKELVASLKEQGALQTVAKEGEIIVESKKRTIGEATEGEEDEEVKDTRGFFGKMFKSAPKKRTKAPRTASRDIKPLSAAPAAEAAEIANELVAVQRPATGRRWLGGVGMAVAVAGAAAVPYLLG